MPNPFYSRDLFVGRDAQLSQLADMLGQGQSALLIGGRRAGKSTLARHLTEDSVGRTLIRTDVSGWNAQSEERALGSLLNRMTGKSETVRNETDHDGMTEALKARCPLAVVIDEADRILGLAWGSAFLSYLRFLDDTELRADIGILLIGGPVLAAFRDPFNQGSPALNTAELVHLDPLDRAGVERLAAPVPGADIDWLMEHGGGHAWITSRLLAALYEDVAHEDALERVFDKTHHAYPVWERQLGDAGRKLLRRLPAEGIVRRELPSRHREAMRLGRSIGAMRFEADRLVRGPSLFSDWFFDRDADEYVWDLAISYASEDESTARAIYNQLSREFKVFYAPEESASLWSTDLDKVLPNTYGSVSRYVLVISSPAYVSKHWTRVEFDAAAAGKSNRILLIDFGMLPENIPPGLVYRGSSSAEMVGLIKALREKLQS